MGHLVLTSKDIGHQIKRKIRDDIYDVELEYIQGVSTLIYDKDQWESLAITSLYLNVADDGKLI